MPQPSSRTVTAKMIEGKGDQIKVSQMPDDGTWPTGTTQYEKRNIAVHVPEWLPENCIQCGRCSLVCPHASIRMKIVKPADLKKAPKILQDRQRGGRPIQGPQDHDPGLHRGLLRLYPLCRYLPGQDQGPEDDRQYREPCEFRKPPTSSTSSTCRKCRTATSTPPPSKAASSSSP